VPSIETTTGSPAGTGAISPIATRAIAPACAENAAVPSSAPFVGRVNVSLRTHPPLARRA
jgi:hypothetical protein